MKYLTYIITFFAYVAVHVMRMSYSFNKSRIKDRYGIDPYFLGILDGCIYLAIGVGFFLRYKITRSDNLTRNYLITAIIVSASFSVIPLLSLLDIGVSQQSGLNTLVIVIISVSMIIFGFFQFSFWPITLVLVNQYFDPKTEGTILGLWSANGDFGNIIGFFIPTLMVNILKSRWEISMLFGSSVNAIMGILVFTCLKMKHRQSFLIVQQDQNQIKQSLLKNPQTYINSTFQQFWQFTKVMFKNASTCLYLLSTGLYKAILYGFLLWCPIFLQSIGQQDFSGYIPMMFNASTLIGSLALGKLYEQKARDYSKKAVFDSKPFQILKNYKLFVASTLLFGTLVLFTISQNNIVYYAVLAFLMGFTLGGIFNMLVTHEIMVFTQGQAQKTDLMSTLAMSVGNISVGILQLIIALALHKAEDQSQMQDEINSINDIKQDDYSAVFDILLVTSAIATVLTFIRIKLNSINRRKLTAKNSSIKSQQQRSKKQSQQKIDM